MHLVHDENGNLIVHGDHNHEDHHDHTHHHEPKDENLAVLTYMLQHNEHHATELVQMAERRRRVFRTLRQRSEKVWRIFTRQTPI